MVPKGANHWLTVMVLCVWLTESVMSKCTQKGPCKCKTDKGTIDLTPFNAKVPAFKDVPDQKDDYQYSYSPCTPFNEGKAECKKVSVCQLSKDHSVSFPAGTVHSAKWGTDSSGANTITYSETDSKGTTRTTVVTLKCTEGKDNLIVLGETSSAVYSMTLESVHCCDGSGPSPSPGPSSTHGPNEGGGSSGSISIGSVICIVVLVLVIGYVAGGIAFQKGVRKAQGKETFPHYTFWSGIPGLIKDGFLFTISGCKRRSGYGRV